MPYSVNNRTVHAFRGESGAIGAALIVVAGTATDQAKLPGGADAGAILGVSLYATGAAGETLEVVTDGIADLTVNAAGSNIAVGDPISIHGVTGRGKKSTLGNTHHILGYAREAATADGVRISVRIALHSMPAA